MNYSELGTGLVVSENTLK